MSDDIASGSAWGGVAPAAQEQPRARPTDARSPLDRRALEQAMILSGSRGSDDQRAVRVGELEQYLGGLSQQFQVPINNLSGLIADPALLFRNAGLSAPEIVDVLPNFGNFPGRMALLTTNNKLYRWTGTEWTASVPTTDLEGEVTGAQIAGNTITGSNIVANTITGGLLAAAGIITQVAQIGDGLITNAKIADAAITRAKIGSAAIGTAQIENGAITNALIGNAAITSANIGDLEVNSAKIADLTVGTEKITASAITTIGAAFGSGFFNRDFQNIVAVAINALGGRTMLVTVSGTVSGSSIEACTGRILRNGVSQADFVTGQQSFYLTGGSSEADQTVVTIPFSFSYTTMITSLAGTNTLLFQHQVASDSTVLSMDSSVTITVTELKR